MSKSVKIALRLVRLGLAAELRNHALRLLAGVAIFGIAALAWTHSAMAGPTSVVLSTWLARGYGIAGCLWCSYAAIRDQDERTGGAIRSKPVDGAFWVLVSWLTQTLLWLLLAAATFLVAGLAQAWGTRSLMPLAGMVIGFGRAALVITVATTLGYCLSRIARSPIGGVLTVFAWFCVTAGLAYIPQYLHVDYSQNQPFFLATAAVLLVFTALVVERSRRGELRNVRAPAAALAALTLLSVAAGARAVRGTPALGGAVPTLWDRIALQHLQEGERLPGFWLPDGRGGTLRTADHEGKILLVFLFRPDDLEASRSIPALDAIAREFAPRGVQPLGVVISPNHGDGWALVRACDCAFPIGADPSTVSAGEPPESAVASAYDAQSLPMLVITDRRRIVRAILRAPSYDAPVLRGLIAQRLAVEPR